MNSIWSITIDDYLNVVDICKKLGMQAGDDMQPVFFEYMKKKGQLPCGHTELNKKELIADLAQKKGNILSIDTDSQGKQTYKVIKNK